MKCLLPLLPFLLVFIVLYESVSHFEWHPSVEKLSNKIASGSLITVPNTRVDIALQNPLPPLYILVFYFA